MFGLLQNKVGEIKILCWDLNVLYCTVALLLLLFYFYFCFFILLWPRTMRLCKHLCSIFNKTTRTRWAKENIFYEFRFQFYFLYVFFSCLQNKHNNNNNNKSTRVKASHLSLTQLALSLFPFSFFLSAGHCV